MARAYSLDLRERVLNAIDGGMSTEDAARKYCVSISWAYSLKKQRRESGSIAPKERDTYRERKLAPYEKEVRQLVADSPDATLVELHEQLPESGDKHWNHSTTKSGVLFWNATRNRRFRIKTRVQAADQRMVAAFEIVVLNVDEE